MIPVAAMAKLTLLDYPGKTAAILFLPGCDMRCPFCHNSDLAAGGGPRTDIKEVYAFLEKRRGLLDGVVVTGGEPSLWDIMPLLRNIRDMGYLVKVDTNGLRPEEIEKWLAADSVDYIAMDIKNSPAKYAATAGLPSVDMNLIKKSVGLIMNSGKEYEFRTTVVRPIHETEDFRIIGEELISGAEQYFLQPFVSRDEVPDRNLTEPDDEFLKKCLEISAPFVKKIEIRGKNF